MSCIWIIDDTYHNCSVFIELIILSGTYVKLPFYLLNVDWKKCCDKIYPCQIISHLETHRYSSDYLYKLLPLNKYMAREQKRFFLHRKIKPPPDYFNMYSMAIACFNTDETLKTSMPLYVTTILSFYVPYIFFPSQRLMVYVQNYLVDQSVLYWYHITLLNMHLGLQTTRNKLNWLCEPYWVQEAISYIPLRIIIFALQR